MDKKKSEEVFPRIKGILKYGLSKMDGVAPVL